MKGKYVDLTHTIYEGMMTYPTHWHPKVEIQEMGTIEREGRGSRKLILGTHTGTHIDAPTHFFREGKTIDQIDLDVCIGPATLISFEKERKDLVEKSDLEQKLKVILSLSEGSLERLIVRFGWSKQFGRPSFYEEYPSFTEEACHWLVEKGIRLLGIDTPSPDHPKHSYKHSNDSPNHKIFLERNVFLLEYLWHLENLKGPDIFLMALPLKILGADGAPARVVAYDRS